MGTKGLNLFKLGLKRRKKEVRRMRIMICLAVFFLAFILLLQDNLGAFQMELNYKNYGRWFAFDDDGVFAKYPYLEAEGQAYVSSCIYSLYPISYSSSEGAINDYAPTIDAVDEYGEPVKQKPPIADENGRYLSPPPHITVENFGGRRTTNCHIGAYTEGFSEKNGVRLYEGRMPQADDEIVMQLGTLHALGVSYELGQSISFYVSETEPLFEPKARDKIEERERSPSEYYLELDLVSFKLVGTLERYTERWSGGSLLPGAIVTEAALDKLPSYKNTYDFYYLKSGAGGEKVWEFASTSFEGFASWRTGLYERLQVKHDEKRPAEEWNVNAFTNPLWGSSGVYRYVTIILMVMGVCILTYLMASYLSKRRQFFMRMREIGATSRDVWRMAAYECVVSALPYAAASLAFAYLTALLAAFFFSKSLDSSFSLIIKSKTLLIIVGAILLVLILALAAALIIYSSRGISERKKALSKRATAKLRTKALKKRKRGSRYLSLFETLKRNRCVHPFKTVLLRIACILIGAMILLSSMQVYSQTYIYLSLKNAPTDLIGGFSDAYNRKVYGYVDTEPQWNVTGTQRVDSSKQTLSVAASAYSVQNLLDESFIGELSSLPGVAGIVIGMEDADHTLEWAGKWSDAFHEECIMRGLDYISKKDKLKLEYNRSHFDDMRRYVDNSIYMLQCSDMGEDVWKAAEKHLFSGADREAFLNGEQVIVFVDQDLYCVNEANTASSSAYMTREDFASSSENLWKSLPSFSAGDTVFINNLNQDGGGTEVKVAAVLPMTDHTQPDMFALSNNENSRPIFVTVGSMALAERVLRADGLEFGANVFGIKLDSIAESENTLKLVSKLCAENRVRYYDTVEDQIESRNYWIDILLTYGLFTVILLVLYAFIVTGIAKENELSLALKYEALHRAGLTVPKMRSQKRLDAVLQSLWQILSFPLYVIINFAQGLMKFGENAARAGTGRLDQMKLLVKSWFTNDFTDPKVALGVVLVLMLMLAVINGRLEYRDGRGRKKLLKGDKSYGESEICA